jgi:hypothetical protein
MPAETSPAVFAEMVERCRAEIGDMTVARAEAVLTGKVRPPCVQGAKWTQATPDLERAARMCGIAPATLRVHHVEATAARAAGRATSGMLPPPVATSPLRWRAWRLVAWRATITWDSDSPGRVWPAHDGYLRQIADLAAARGKDAPPLRIEDVRAELGVGYRLARDLLREGGWLHGYLPDTALARQVVRILARDGSRTTARAVATELHTSERRAARFLAAAGGVSPKRVPVLEATRADGLVTAREVAKWAGVDPATVTRRVQAGAIHLARVPERHGRHPMLLFYPGQVMQEWPGVDIG